MNFCFYLVNDLSDIDIDNEISIGDFLDFFLGSDREDRQDYLGPGQDDWNYKLENEIPYVNGQPICGHWFWDNNYGATEFCQRIGLGDGIVIKTKHTYNEDAMFIGECGPEPDYPGYERIFPRCEERSDHTDRHGEIHCEKGQKVGMKIQCQKGKYFLFYAVFKENPIYDLSVGFLAPSPPPRPHF